MADTNTYTSKQNIKKYTTQAKFDAIDKSDVPVGTEYNIVGSIAESDLDSDLQAKVNLTGDGLTTEITGGKVKVKNPMTSTGGNGFELNSFYNATTGVTYFFPIETPIGHFATGIVPIIGSITSTKPGSTAPATYQGVLLPNAYSENNYGPNAYGMLTMSESNNSGNQIYILPYCSSNSGISHLLSEYSITAGTGITIRDTTSGQSTPILEISATNSGGGGTTYTAGKNIVIDGTTIAMADSLTGINSITITGGQYGGASICVGATNDSPIESSGPYTFCVARYTEMFGTYKPTRYALVFPGGTGATIADNYFSAYFPTGNGTLTTETSFKTLFGNQNIVGSGNIDLYSHFITINARSDGTNGKRLRAFVKKTSSNNLKVDSLTDLKTLFGNTFQWDANGYISDRDSNDLPINTTVIYGITESGLQYIPHDGSIPTTFNFASAASLTFTDDVKTI